MDWKDHKKHRQYVAEKTGAWWGLADNNGTPILDLPPALPDYEIPETLNATTAARAKFNIRSRAGHVHPAVGVLIDRKIGSVESDKTLSPALRGTFFLYYQSRTKRREYMISYTAISGPATGPTVLEIKGGDMLSLVDGVPLWSYPRSLRGNWITTGRDFAALWEKPRTIQNVKFAAQADGFIIDGPAEQAIRRAITESLEATWRAVGRADDPPVVVSQSSSGLRSPSVMIRPDDGYLWQTLGPIAAMAGVVIRSRMWLPEDPPVAGHTLTKPTIVVDVEQREV